MRRLQSSRTPSRKKKISQADRRCGNNQSERGCNWNATQSFKDVRASAVKALCRHFNNEPTQNFRCVEGFKLCLSGAVKLQSVATFRSLLCSVFHLGMKCTFGPRLVGFSWVGYANRANDAGGGWGLASYIKADTDAGFYLNSANPTISVKSCT